MTELPKGWVEVPIGEVCEVVGGSTPSTKVAKYWDGEIPWLTPDDLARDRSQYISVGRRSITKAGYESCSTQLVPAGTVLFTSRAPIGYVSVARHSICTNQGFKSFVPPSGLSSDYLYWYLRWATPAIRDMGSGTTFAEVSGKVARAIPLRLAPQREQERIVAAIEEQCSRLDDATCSLSAANEKLLALRRVMLSAVVPTACDWVLTSDVADVQGGIQKQPKRRPVKNRYPFLRVANVGRNRLDLSEVHEVELFDGELERYRLQPGDLLVVEGNGSPDQIGRSAMWRGEIADAVHQNHLIRVRPRFTVDPEYLSLYWNAPQTAERLRAVASSTSGLYTLSTAKVKAIPVPMVDLGEQRRIVAEAELQTTILDALATAIDHALTRCEHLQRAILERAFSGRLVAQDPDDEPASELLARIARERAASAQPRRKRS